MSAANLRVYSERWFLIQVVWRPISRLTSTGLWAFTWRWRGGRNIGLGIQALLFEQAQLVLFQLTSDPKMNTFIKTHFISEFCVILLGKDFAVLWRWAAVGSISLHAALRLALWSWRAVTAVRGRLSGGECYILVFVCHSVYKTPMHLYETSNHLL